MYTSMRARGAVGLEHVASLGSTLPCKETGEEPGQGEAGTPPCCHHTLSPNVRGGVGRRELAITHTHLAGEAGDVKIGDLTK